MQQQQHLTTPLPSGPFTVASHWVFILVLTPAEHTLKWSVSHCLYCSCQSRCQRDRPGRNEPKHPNVKNCQIRVTVQNFGLKWIVLQQTGLTQLFINLLKETGASKRNQTITSYKLIPVHFKTINTFITNIFQVFRWTKLTCSWTQQ